MHIVEFHEVGVEETRCCGSVEDHVVDSINQMHQEEQYAAQNQGISDGFKSGFVDIRHVRNDKYHWENQESELLAHLCPAYRGVLRPKHPDEVDKPRQSKDDICPFQLQLLLVKLEFLIENELQDGAHKQRHLEILRREPVKRYRHCQKHHYQQLRFLKWSQSVKNFVHI